jgi:hypothetical protein
MTFPENVTTVPTVRQVFVYKKIVLYLYIKILYNLV